MNTNSIFNTFGRFSEVLDIADDINHKKEQIASVTDRTCGNCSHWMKSSCIPEKKHKLFRSMNGAACDAFTMGASSQRMEQEFRVELNALMAKLRSAQGKPTDGGK